MRIVDLTGRKFGALYASRRLESERKPNGRMVTMYHCICDCGGTKVASSRNLVAGDVKSCGCMKGQGRSEFTGVSYTLEESEKPWPGIDEAICDLEMAMYGRDPPTFEDLMSAHTVVSVRKHKIDGGWVNDD